MASGDSMSSSRDRYNNMNKISTRSELLRLYNKYVNNGKGGYFPTAYFKIGKNELAKLKSKDKAFQKSITKAIKRIESLF